MHAVGAAARDRRRSRLAFALAVLGTLIVVGSFASMVVRGRTIEAMYGNWMFHNGPTAALALWFGYLVIERMPRHRGGLLLVGIGITSTLHVATFSVADARLMAAGVEHDGRRFASVIPAELPLDAAIPTWMASWLWIPAVVMLITVFLLTFPDGRPPTDRRRLAVPLAGAAVVLLASAFSIPIWPGSERETVISELDDAPPITFALLASGGVALTVAVALSISALVGRWRRADPDERRRMRPVVVSASVLAVVALAPWPWQVVWIPAVLIALYVFIGSYGFAIARYGLHDLEFFVSRAVVAAILAVTFTGVYLAIVVGIGHLVGRGRDSDLLPLIAVGVVAVAFEPFRRRVRRWVDHLLYGHDRDAYEVLSGIADRLRSAASNDDVLREVAELLLRGTGAQRIDIVATARGSELVLATDGHSDRENALWAVPVAHEGEPLGRIRVFARSSADLAPRAPSLVDDVAATIGVVLRNAQLTADLHEQVRALRLAGERLVHAQDEARRELERDLHDGAQARLIALKIRLGIAERRAAGRDDAELAAMIRSIGDEVDDAVRTLRELGHGLRPSVLEGAGIAAALRAEARSLALDVVVDDRTEHRYDPAIESAVYFSCLEAIQNAAKHGRAAQVVVELRNGDGVLDFRVTDDGVGFDVAATHDGAGLTNVHDRLTTLGGDVSIDAAIGNGTTVAGRLPVQPLVSDR